MKNRIWLAFANEAKCNHVDCIRNENYINWVMGKNFHFHIGDIVYLFMSDTRKVQFKMLVTNENCQRTDSKYWNIEAPRDVTYKLILADEYSGNMLNENRLKYYGLKSGSDIENPCYSKTVLIQYIESVFNSPKSCIKDETQYEGEIHLQIHKYLERNRKIVSQAKDDFKAKHGRLYCEVCGFDFEKRYGERGKDFIEAHHIVPISNYSDKHPIKISDFAMLCSNCHSMVHRVLNKDLDSLQSLRRDISKTL